MSSPRGPGKTSPCLVKDLYLYDLHKPPPNGLDILRDPPPVQLDGQFPEILAPGSCLHQYYTKPKQCQLPALDERPSLTSLYKLAATCRKCRTRAEVIVDFRDKWENRPCPNADHPLHHLVYSPEKSDSKPAGPNGSSWDLRHAFVCSSPTCSAVVHVRLKPPILNQKWLVLLTDQSLLKQRADEAMKVSPDRFEGMKPQAPIDVLSNLRTYIINAVDGADSRSIVLHNKRFTLGFGIDGQPSREILEALGFTYHENVAWDPPKPNVQAPLPLHDQLDILLDDAEIELSILIGKMQTNETKVSQGKIALESSSRELARILGHLDYDKAPAPPAGKIISHIDPPFYRGLGVPSDAADHLVIFAYKRQIWTDSEKSHLYLDYLRNVAQDRGSETLEMFTATEFSSGKYDTTQLNEAYLAFAFDPLNPPEDEDHIIGSFLSRISDSPRQEPDMRRHLQVIGQHRNSEKIKAAADDSLNTYEQALSYLSVEKDTQDEFISSMFVAKTSENPSEIEKARKAVNLIADARDSIPLRNWLDTGQLGEVEMDAGAAYSRLGIDDRTISDELILTTYDTRVMDNPERIEDYRRALIAIGKETGSRDIQSYLMGVDPTAPPVAPDRPVGLENIGNTCYLNSLLQCYFTVTELRSIVLNFDDYKVDLHSPEMSKKQVGSRKVTIPEAERAQAFVVQLGKLFEDMITSPRSSVKPEQELARLTLMNAQAEKRARTKSLTSIHRPSIGQADAGLGTIGGMPVAGPLGPPQASEKLKVLNMDEVLSPTGLDSIEEKTPETDNSSEATLVSKSNSDYMVIDGEPEVQKKDQQQAVLNDKENLPPHKSEEPDAHSPSHTSHTAPLSETSPSRINAQAGENNPSMDDAKKASEEIEYEPPIGPPNRPPPVPPRPNPGPTLQQTIEIASQQQDVTEVINNVLYQLSCAIKPTGIAEDGEQLDHIKSLFYGTIKTFTKAQDKAVSSKEQRFCDIPVNVWDGPKDIYTALDGAFDPQEVDYEGSVQTQYASISELPKILQVMVQRAQFDPVRGVPYKSNYHLDLKETIYLDRYMDDQGETSLMERRKQCWAWKSELARLEARRKELTEGPNGVPAITALEDAKNIMMELQNDLADDEDGNPLIQPQAIDTLEALAEDARLELDDIAVQVKTLLTNITSQFTDLRRLPYRLHSVFIHRGYVNSGHYWIYIYDFKREIWRKYNDGYVDEVRDTRDIFEEPPDVGRPGVNPPTAYYLTYVRDDQKETLVESVCRDIKEPPPAPPRQQDVEMTDYAGATDTGEHQHQGTVSATIPNVNTSTTPSQGDWNATQANTADVRW